MKKVKIMLTSLSVLALVGGALAFKAKNFSGTVYCATTAHQGATAGSANCPAFSPSTFATTITAVSFCTITNGTACNTAAKAPVSAQ